jgi:hypothetical protein
MERVAPDDAPLGRGGYLASMRSIRCDAETNDRWSSWACIEPLRPLRRALAAAGRVGGGAHCVGGLSRHRPGWHAVRADGARRLREGVLRDRRPGTTAAGHRARRRGFEGVRAGRGGRCGTARRAPDRGRRRPGVGAAARARDSAIVGDDLFFGSGNFTSEVGFAIQSFTEAAGVRVLDAFPEDPGQGAFDVGADASWIVWMRGADPDRNNGHFGTAWSMAAPFTTDRPRSSRARSARGGDSSPATHPPFDAWFIRRAATVGEAMVYRRTALVASAPLIWYLTVAAAGCGDDGGTGGGGSSGDGGQPGSGGDPGDQGISRPEATCRPRCDAPADCGGPACVDGICEKPSCGSDGDCGEGRVCSPFAGETGVPECVVACTTSADCGDPTRPPYDEDNYACTDGACEWLGCRTDEECAADDGASFPVCRPIGDSAWCFAACTASEDCAADTPGSNDGDNWACIDGACAYLGCHDDMECEETLGPNSPLSAVTGSRCTLARPPRRRARRPEGRVREPTARLAAAGGHGQPASARPEETPRIVACTASARGSLGRRAGGTL